jgi:hypothetical protein
MLEAEKGGTKSPILGRQALVAALPVLLYGLCVAAIAAFLLSIGGPSQIVNLARGPVWHYGALVVGLLALAALVAAAVIALFGCLPAWSYTWIGAAMMGFLIAINLVVDDRDFALSPVVDRVLVALFCLSALIVFGRAAWRGWPHSGLFTAGIAATLGLSLCFFAVAGPFPAYLGGLAALVGAIEAALVYAYVRGSNTTRFACLAGVGIANLAIAWLVEWAFRSAHPTRGIGQFWSLAALLTALLVGGTLAGSFVSFVRRLFRRH